MILLLNPRAAGGTAPKKWKSIEDDFRYLFPATPLHILNGPASTRELLQQALRAGERDFVAAGGDGTVNLALNALLSVSTESQIPEIRLGALGLGSSNDFHKPFLRGHFMGNVPGKLDFQHAMPHDIGCLTFNDNGHTVQRHFIANASCGITAEANWLFNNPDPILAWLKRSSTPLAIAYAALRTIFRYKNFEAILESPGLSPWPSHLTNLAILKNPHVSGSFRYDTPVEPDDGAFIINLCEDMTTRELLRLLFSLARGRFSSLPKTQTWHQSGLTVRASKPFAVEFDGEVISTCSVTFSILPQYIQVCP
jgi:diacylglycerol kinase family enzyme